METTNHSYRGAVRASLPSEVRPAASCLRGRPGHPPGTAQSQQEPAPHGHWGRVCIHHRHGHGGRAGPQVQACGRPRDPSLGTAGGCGRQERGPGPGGLQQPAVSPSFVHRDGDHNNVRFPTSGHHSFIFRVARGPSAPFGGAAPRHRPPPSPLASCYWQGRAGI